MNLTDFAVEEKASTGKKTRCMTCNLPADVLNEIHDAREGDRRISFPIIAKWLKAEHGIEILHTTIRNHFIAEHSRG